MEKKYFMWISVFGIISLITLMLLFSTSFRSFSGATMQLEKSTNGMADRMGYSGGSNKEMAQSESGAPSDVTFGTMIFQNYGANIFMDASYDSKSTFSLDVDTASYTISKNYILNGALPPTDAIRPEEFINYLDYNYPSPSEDFYIDVQTSTSPFDELSYLRIGLKAKENVKRKPVVLTFVIDNSGSMAQGNRLELVKQAVEFLIDNLDDGDSIGIVTYETYANILLQHTKVSDKETILSALSKIQPMGSTNAEAGLILGYQQANTVFDRNKVNRVILMSDGVANVGNTDSGSILAQLKTYKEKGIALTAVGVGLGNYNDALLEQIADKADGNYAYINDFEEVKRVFSKQLLATLQVAARDAKIQVEFDPKVVRRYRLIGYENREMADAAFLTDTQDAGEVGAGHEVTAVYELELTGEKSAIGKVNLRYNDVNTDEVKQITKDVPYSNKEFSTMPTNYRMAIFAARFAQALKHTQPPPDINTISKLIEPLDIDSGFKKMVEDAKVIQRKITTGV